MNAATENATIARLTGDAVRHEGERVIAEMLKQIALMEQVAAELRGKAEDLAIDIRKHTGLFADHTAGFVERCQKIIDMMQSVDSVFIESIRPLETNVPVNAEELLATITLKVPEGEEVKVNRGGDLFSTMKGDH